MNNQEEQMIIMKMVETIFQNISYLRWISGIQAFRNQQIYFQICNFIFPHSYILMIKIRQSNLSSTQKIEKLIALIGRQIRMDLSHISASEIVKGNIQHLYNLLELLQVLSAHIYSKKSNIQIKSAPPQKSSIQQHQSLLSLYGTVIGIPKQFIYKQFQFDSKGESQNILEQEKQLINIQERKQIGQNKKCQIKKFKDILNDRRLVNLIVQTKQQQLKIEGKKLKKSKNKMIGSSMVNIVNKTSRYNKNNKLNYESKQIRKKQKMIENSKINFIKNTSMIINELQKSKIKDLKKKRENFKKQIQGKTKNRIKTVQNENSKIRINLSQRLQKADYLKKKLNFKRNTIIKTFRKQVSKQSKQSHLTHLLTIEQQKQKIHKLITEDSELDHLISEIKKY